MVTFTDDAGLAAEIAELVNRVYAEAEAGLWLGGAARTSETEVADLIHAGQMAVVRTGERVVGAVRVQQLGDGLGEFGMLVAAPEERGTGLGRDLVSFAERWGRERGLSRMQLELLVPRTWNHPVKDFLRAWYTRIGYRVVRTGDLGEDYPALVPRLACPCDFLVFHKAL
ncbi:acetyltransferase (GNAT) family protein [Lentzea atacamensis]|uniref:Acetyltransferase (GNAT) family protein n=1 Tax=Lentzea atacamensis TaxID=531938 RepID=A0A316I433_9PSEU|nr:GNAT family N-acetyltransferase [Lentzea atacamensis]PWK87177.1 acetyltransferase (GNAT) family protein [Lentzea atacamensis]